MQIAEAILYLLAKKNGGMTTDQLADEINRNKLVVLNGGKPVSSAYVYRTVMQHPETFCKAEGRIFLMI